MKLEVRVGRLVEFALAPSLFRPPKCAYFSGFELTLPTDRHWHPRPDVAGALELEEPYPIKPIDIAIVGDLIPTELAVPLYVLPHRK